MKIKNILLVEVPRLKRYISRHMTIRKKDTKNEEAKG